MNHDYFEQLNQATTLDIKISKKKRHSVEMSKATEQEYFFFVLKKATSSDSF